MRILHFTSSLGWRGHEQMIIDIFESLRDNNFVKDQMIICPKDSEIFKVAIKKNLKVLGVDFKSEYSLGLAKKFKNEANKFQPDISFLHNSKAHTIAVLAAMVFGLKHQWFCLEP